MSASTTSRCTDLRKQNSHNPWPAQAKRGGGVFVGPSKEHIRKYLDVDIAYKSSYNEAPQDYCTTRQRRMPLYTAYGTQMIGFGLRAVCFRRLVAFVVLKRFNSMKSEAPRSKYGTDP